MIVQKFGGTSVGSAGAIARLAEIVRAHRDRSPVVVVSAVGGVTNKLFALANQALAGSDTQGEFAALAAQHHTILKELGLPAATIARELAELERLVSGIGLIRELTPRTMDQLASFGERLSVRIVAAHLTHSGTPARAFEAHEAGLLTDGRFGGARPLPESETSIRAALEGVRECPVITGYIGRDKQGNITTLGRGGSDYSAAIFGAALGAQEIQIWTDVDGVMSADPRIVPQARQVPMLSFAEAAELAFFGAKVLHPATMVPAIEKNIPIRVLNSFRPEHPGTAVVARLSEDQRALKSITSKDRIAVVSIVAAPMLNQYGFLERIADVFARHEIVVDMIATSEVSVALTTDASAKLEPVVEELSRFSEARVLRELAMISIVGEELQSSLRVPARVFARLEALIVRVEMISYGATRNNLCFLVPRERLREVVLELHRELFEA
ncbi:MAG: aspartate kinase [Planctomycetia bacterium]